MMHKIFAASCLAGIIITGAAAPAYAGPPGDTCQNTANSSGTGQLTTPGHSGSSPGSVFNEPGFGSTSGGTGGQAYGGAPVPGGNGAPSQYDVACFKNQSGGLSGPLAPASTAPTTLSAGSTAAPASTAPAATAPTTVKHGHTPHGG
jgi:hypothetical protein